jgi:ABC-2 type transport system permease protein
MASEIAAYPRMIRASAQVALTYRARLVLLLSSALFPMLLLFVWLTVAAESTVPNGWGSDRFVSYYLAAAVVNDIANSGISWSWDSDVRSGELSAKLLRPVSVFSQYVAAEAGQKIVSGAMLLPVAVVGAVLLQLSSFQRHGGVILATITAVLVAFVLAALMSSTFALIGFWSTQSSNLYLVWWGLGAFLSGWVAPLALMPPALARVAMYLPFRYILGFPVEIALGISKNSIPVGFLISLGWIAIFGGAYRFLWRRGIRRYQAVGG